MLRIRQGDIMLSSVEQLPKGKRVQLERDANGRPVLAHGEVTGHKHLVEVAEPEVKDIAIEWIQIGRRRFLEAKAEVAIKHDEHRTLVLPPGLYEMTQQQQFTEEAIEPAYD